MPRRNVIFFCGISFFFGSLIMMFKQLDHQQGGRDIVLRESNGNMVAMNSRLGMLEAELKESKLTMDKV